MITAFRRRESPQIARNTLYQVVSLGFAKIGAGRECMRSSCEQVRQHIARDVVYHGIPPSESNFKFRFLGTKEAPTPETTISERR